MRKLVVRKAALVAMVAVLVPEVAAAQRGGGPRVAAATTRATPIAIATTTVTTLTPTTTTTTTTPATTPATTTTVHARGANARRGPARRAAARCEGAVVSIVRESGGGHWTGALTDCHGRPTVRALAAMSLLAAAREVSGEPDVAPMMRAIRRMAPAAGWELADEGAPSVTHGACPAGQEPVPGRARENVAGSGRARGTSSAGGTGAAHASGACRAITVPRDPHTHDAMVVMDGRVRVLHPRLLQMLARVTEHFPGHRVEIISGYRPSRNPRAGSRHAHARALDFRVEGVRRETLRDFAHTLPDAGVGYYPNSVFVHMDVRDVSEGSARWTDYSSPREHPRYGAWPPRSRDVRSEARHVAGQTAHTVNVLREAMDDDGADGADPSANQGASPGANASAEPAQPAPPAAPPPPPAAP